MHILKELLLETAAGSFVEKYKALYGNAKPVRAERIKDALEKLEAGVKADSIYNVDFGDIKDLLSRALEDELKQLDDFSRTDDRQTSPHMLVYMADISAYVYLNQTKGQIKKINNFLKDHPNFPADDKEKLKAMLAVNEAGAEIFDIMTKLKPKIIKGRKPNTNIDPNAFQSKLGSEQSQKLVKEKLEAGVKEPLDAYEKAVHDWLKSIIDNINKTDTYKQSKDRQKRNKINDMVFFKCFEFDEGVSTKDDTVYKILKLTQKGKDFAETESKAQRDIIERRYLAKNIKKLSHVIDLKGNLSKIEEHPYNKPKIASGSGTIESGFTFFFDDGSEFKVINKIVTKYSYAGTRFEQFPTTFHNVKFPDGTMMKSPSEEKMVKEFGNWKP